MIAINSLTSSFFLLVIPGTVGSERERRREEGGIHFYSFFCYRYDTTCMIRVGCSYRLFVRTVFAMSNEVS